MIEELIDDVVGFAVVVVLEAEERVVLEKEMDDEVSVKVVEGVEDVVEIRDVEDDELLVELDIVEDVDVDVDVIIAIEEVEKREDVVEDEAVEDWGGGDVFEVEDDVEEEGIDCVFWIGGGELNGVPCACPDC